MIHPSELRVGNWLMGPDGVTRQVNAIYKGYINILIDGDGLTGGYLMEMYGGIPLTPEILEQCGFARFESRFLWTRDLKLIKTCIAFTKDREALVYDKYPNTGISVPIRIEFVHQLQNLYFALTGEELQYKSES